MLVSIHKIVFGEWHADELLLDAFHTLSIIRNYIFTAHIICAVKWIIVLYPQACCESLVAKFKWRQYGAIKSRLANYCFARQ